MKGCQSRVRYLVATYDLVSSVSSSSIFLLNNLLSFILSRKRENLRVGG